MLCRTHLAATMAPDSFGRDRPAKPADALGYAPSQGSRERLVVQGTQAVTR